MAIPVIVYVGGQIVQHVDGGPWYSGGTTLHLSMQRGITLLELQEMISNAAGLPYTSMKITYRFPSIRFPNPTYQHVPLEILDNTGVDLIFHVHAEIPGYIPILFVESTNVPAYPGIVQEQFPGESSQPQHYDNETTFGDFAGQCSQYRYNYDTTSLQGQNSEEFPFHDTTFRGSASQVHNELIEEEHEGLDEETDEGSESSLEDVDAALEADGFEDHYIDGQGNVIPALKPPCPMYTQDTWSNIIDPSTPMPTRSHLGWDGRSEFFEGQVIISQLILFQSESNCKSRAHSF
ncbi:hypothetical protein RHGRI_016782 [Rhododendron griersonianum]|uniref:Uncharacterized protein n=1 Tax=Rhododendron griersonianum TaxID=479676 RepID=A0AAV6JVC9_9ERIC|nr:hypothetical protein RHGRI_016782 [Rhododendron griersonianum]